MPVDPVEQNGSELVAFDRGAALRLLTEGELEIVGRLVEASNATLYCRVRLDGKQAACVYKPVAGERPLWDFPDGTLAGREVAAYAVSETAGWGTVPPTVLRDGPFGPGMCQLWIDVDESVDVVAMLRGSDPRLRPIVLFDAVVNNADRKGGHLLPTETGRIFARRSAFNARRYAIPMIQVDSWEAPRNSPALVQITQKVSLMTSSMSSRRTDMRASRRESRW